MGSKKKKKLSTKLSDWGSGPGNAYANVLEEMLFRDRIKPSWQNLGKLASRMYDDAQDAFDILQRNADKTLKTINFKRFHLAQLIDDQRDKKINKGKGLRTVIRENLEGCCKIINIPFHLVGPSKTQINENPKIREESNMYDFDETVEKIDRKYRRVVDDPVVRKEFKKWQRDEFKRKDFNAFLIKKKPPKK